MTDLSKEARIKHHFSGGSAPLGPEGDVADGAVDDVPDDLLQRRDRLLQLPLRHEQRVQELEPQRLHLVLRKKLVQYRVIQQV